MGPIKSIPRIELDLHWILVHLIDQLNVRRLVKKGLGHFEHAPEPLDVDVTLGVKSLDELGGNRLGHFIFSRQYLLSDHSTALLLFWLAREHQEKGQGEQGPVHHVLGRRFHLLISN